MNGELKGSSKWSFARAARQLLCNSHESPGLARVSGGRQLPAWVRVAGRASSLCGAGLFLLLSSTSSPLAADMKAYHGNYCRGLTLGDWINYANDAAGVQVLVGEADIICPIMRERAGSTTNLYKVVVEIKHQSVSTMMCTLAVQYEDTADGAMYDYVIKTVPEGRTQIEYTGLSSQGGDEAAYSFICNLRVGDLIHHYYVDERAGTE
jgi:hypothetical protein